MTKLCECGCGLPAPIAKETMRKRGYEKGQPQRFLVGHVAKTYGRHDTLNRTLVKGYVHICMPSHPRADHKGYVAEHIMIAQAALGKPLPVAAVVPHVNTTRTDNRNRNLVICQDHAYHKLLHRRMRVKALGGNPNTDAICSQCGPRPITDFGSSKNGLAHDCKRCATVRARARSGHQPWKPGGKGRPPLHVTQ